MVASSHSPAAKISSGVAYSGSSSGLFSQAEGSYSSCLWRWSQEFLHWDRFRQHVCWKWFNVYVHFLLA